TTSASARRSSHRRTATMTPKRLTLVIAAAVAALACAAPAFATPPGHNGLITFSADTGTGYRLYTVGANGNDLHQVAPLLAGDAAHPDWSPDGSEIVFELDTDVAASVDLIRPDGTGLVNLTPGPDFFQGQPSFTPDGKQIVFERFDPATNDDSIWIMN